VRALLACPPAARAALADAMLRQAEEADRHRRQTGLAHPRYGTGSLMAAALRHPLAPLPDQCDTAYCGCLLLLLDAILAPAGR